MDAILHKTYTLIVDSRFEDNKIEIDVNTISCSRAMEVKVKSFLANPEGWKELVEFSNQVGGIE